MDTRSLLILKTVLSAGGINAAARKLNCSASTVSFQVRLLEEELGVQLLEKVGRTVRPTESALRLLPDMDAMLAAHSRLIAKRPAQPELTGKLRILAQESLLAYKLLTIIRDFRKLAPNIELYAEIYPGREAIERVKNAEADLAVTFKYPERPIPIQLTSHHLGVFDLVLVASPDLHFDNQAFTMPGAKPNTTLLTNNAEGGPAQIFINSCKERNISMRDITELRSMDAVRQALVLGLGVAYVLRFQVAKELADGSLRELRCAAHPQKLDACLIKRAGAEESAATSLFSRLVLTSSPYVSVWEDVK